MEKVMVDLDDLKLGSTLAEDIVANTTYPIAYKQSKVNREMLLAFRAFNIKSIEVEKNAVVVINEKTKITKIHTNKQKESFEVILNESISKFKHEFANWEAGAKVDIVKAREIILPLIDEVINDRTKIFLLNDFSNSKEYIYRHSVAIALVTAVIATKMNFNKGDVAQIATAGLLADCGMAKVSKRIRMKPTSLTENEFKEIMSHPAHSLKMVKDISILKNEMKLAIFQHHERLDGSGYPSGTKGDAITKIAHIIAVADIFHAMTSERLYKTKESVFKVLEIIRESAFGKYRADVIQALLSSVGDLPLGTVVELSNGLIGTIVYINKEFVTRPVIKMEHNDEIIDLNKKRDIFIHRLHV